MTHFSRLLLLPLVLLFAASAFADADLAITPAPSQYPDRIEVGFAIVNHGPDVARNAVFTIEVPEGLTVTRLGYGSGDVIKQCDSSQRPIRCEAGDINVGLPFHYGSIAIKTPIADATYTLKFTLTSDTPDPSLANNRPAVTWQTKIEANVSISLTAKTERTDPAGIAAFTASICNTVRDNRPPTVRVEFTATGGTIGFVAPATGFTCRMEGTTGVCTRAELPWGCASEFKLDVLASADRRGREARVTARVISDLPDTDHSDNQASKATPVYRWLTVDNTADDGPGSLRQAITDANAGCTPGPCRIVFEIPKPVPAAGYFTITPSTPLPSITADRVTLEGDRQTAFTGNTNQRGPEIEIDGRLAHRGIRMLALCEGVVNGLAIGHFDEDQGLWFSTGGSCDGRPDRREVKNNHIGWNADGFVPWPNQRGLRLDFAEGVTVSQNVIASNRFSGVWMWRGSATIRSNYIAENGASGVFLGPEVFAASVSDNVIRHHPQMGIAIARKELMVPMRRNQMMNNGGLGIDWGLDGADPVDSDDHEKPSNAPVLLSAVYDEARNLTTISLTVKSQPLGRYFNSGVFDFFTNEGPDGDGEWYIGSASGNPSGQTLTASFTGEHRRKWINATWTREHTYGVTSPKDPKPDSHFGGIGATTSELSNTVLVQ